MNRNVISIHAPRVGSDTWGWPKSSKARPFQSTLPVWGATSQIPFGHHLKIFQSTLPVWGATYSVEYFTEHFLISIHAPRVGSDNVLPSPRQAIKTFQSTLPVWGATQYYTDHTDWLRISIHAPRVGSDLPT